MNGSKFKRVISLILFLALVISLSAFTLGCAKEESKQITSFESTVPTASGDIMVIGKGETRFYFSAVSINGKEAKWEIHTDEKTVGQALIKEKLISGEEGPYGLYVKTVNGATLDYERDGYYWAFYEGDEYALKGADLTEIKADGVYSVRASK